MFTNELKPKHRKGFVMKLLLKLSRVRRKRNKKIRVKLFDFQIFEALGLNRFLNNLNF